MSTPTYWDSISADIAPALGPEWSVCPSVHGDRGQLRGPNGAVLILAPDRSDPARLIIFGVFPQAQNFLRAAHRIGVGHSRGAHIIAGEITRRLLPEYTAELAKAHETIRQQTEVATANQRHAEQIRDQFPGSVIEPGNGHAPQSIRLRHAGRYVNVVRFNADTTVSIQLTDIPAPVLAQILAVLSAPPEE